MSQKAGDPGPKNSAKSAPLDATLTWTPGYGTQTHTVYFGTSREEVSNASGGTPQAAPTYTPAAPLAKGTTYYWRVDESDGTNTFKGEVWSFTVMGDITITDPDLVGWWTFDEGGTTKALDFSGHGNDGTYGGPVPLVDGIVGNAIQLTGSYVAIDGVVDDIKTTNITLSAWIKTTQASEGNLFAANDSASGYALMFGVQGGNPYRWDQDDQQFPPAINDNQWHLLTYVRDGATASIYVDGTLRGTYTASFSWSSPIVTRWSIGQEWDDSSPSDFYSGVVDDVRIYTRALTADEVMGLMRMDPTGGLEAEPEQRRHPGRDQGRGRFDLVGGRQRQAARRLLRNGSGGGQERRRFRQDGCLSRPPGRGQLHAQGDPRVGHRAVLLARRRGPGQWNHHDGPRLELLRGRLPRSWTTWKPIPTRKARRSIRRGSMASPMA